MECTQTARGPIGHSALSEICVYQFVRNIEKFRNFKFFNPFKLSVMCSPAHFGITITRVKAYHIQIQFALMSENQYNIEGNST